MLFGRRRLWHPSALILVALLVGLLYLFDEKPSFPVRYYSQPYRPEEPQPPLAEPQYDPDENANFLWRTLPVRHPAPSIRPLPSGRPLQLPPVQATNLSEPGGMSKFWRDEYRKSVKQVVERCWSAYRSHAWGADEVAPESGGARNSFGGWGATLVDSLDTLWIVGMRREFDEAVNMVGRIDFANTSATEINLFETNIRFLGGLLSAHDLSGNRVLLVKAREVGDLLLAAFDTPNRMPIARWKLHVKAEDRVFEAGGGGGGGDRPTTQEAQDVVLLAEMGSLSLEFTRLSMLTNDPRYYDATQRVMEALAAQQEKTAVPGMWPVLLNARTRDFAQPGTYTLGAMADSAYEYLAKMHALVGGLLPMYEKMYLLAADAAAKHNLFRPMTPDDADILVAGHVQARRDAQGRTSTILEPQGQHLACFAGGMYALGGRLFENEHHMQLAWRLVDGCVWAYRNMPLGIMPESFSMHPCVSIETCKWDEDVWRRAVLDQARYPTGDDAPVPLSKSDEIINGPRRLPKGFTAISDARYLLRPEAIESLFVLYRTTGQHHLLDVAVDMWAAIVQSTSARLAHSAVVDVSVGVDRQKTQKSDSMESFWLGETLKYFYLIFSEPELISLDEWVFNTEAHPFKRLLPLPEE